MFVTIQSFNYMGVPMEPGDVIPDWRARNGNMARRIQVGHVEIRPTPPGYSSNGTGHQRVLEQPKGYMWDPSTGCYIGPGNLGQTLFEVGSHLVKNPPGDEGPAVDKKARASKARAKYAKKKKAERLTLQE